MDEELQTMKQQTVSSIRVSAGLFRIAMMIKQAKSGMEINENDLQRLAKQSFAFTGKETDLGYFYNRKLLPFDNIEMLAEDVREKTLNILKQAEQEGYVSYIKELKVWELTQQGKDLLQNPQFRNNVVAEQERIEQELKEILTKDGKIEYSFVADGKMSDMAVFLTTDKINILDFEEQGRDMKEVIQRFNFFEVNGLVTINENGDIVPTEQGYKFLESDTFKEKCAKEVLAKTTIKQNGKVIVGKENSLSALVKDGQDKLAKKTGKEVAKQTANTVADGALATAPTGVTQGVVIAKKIIEVGAKTLNVGKSLSRTRE